MEPQFDEFDAGILSERQSARYGISEPEQGDYIQRKDGLFSRITSIGSTNVQTLGYGADNGFDALDKVQKSGSFHFGTRGYMSFSGGLNQGVPKTHLRDTGNFKKASCWFFHHGESCAHNGVQAMANVRVWELLEDSEAIDSSIPARYILKAGDFKGSIQTSTYTTFDGVERVAYNGNKPLTDYLLGNPDKSVISSEEFDSLLAAHYESLKTKPEEITKESYWQVYECLPPSKWKIRRGVNSWHCSERLTGNLVSWFFEIGDKYYSFTDDASLSDDVIESYIASVIK